MTVDPAGGSVQLVITDTGPGIEPDELPHLFDRFWRGRAATGTPGSGVGLTVVAELVAAPVAVDQLLEAHAVPGRPADVGRQHADALGEEVLIEPGVHVLGALLRLGAAVDRQHHRVRTLAVRLVR